MRAELEREINRLTGTVIGAAIEVHRRLGPGLMESVYQACLAYELGLRGIATRREVPIPLRYKGVQIDCGYRIDLLVGGESPHGDTAQRDVAQRDVTEGEVTKGEVTKGEVTKGEVTKGEVTKGEVTKGGTTKGGTTKGGSTDANTRRGDITRASAERTPGGVASASGSTGGGVIVELKTVRQIEPVHVAQLLTYLKCARRRAGLLINFNAPLLKDGIRRVVNPDLDPSRMEKPSLPS